MSNTDPIAWVLALLQGMLVGAGVILALFVGVSILVGTKKLRRTGRAGARNLDELVGDDRFACFLPADTPRGPIDQLKAGTSGGRLP